MAQVLIETLFVFLGLATIHRSSRGKHNFPLISKTTRKQKKKFFYEHSSERKFSNRKTDIVRDARTSIQSKK